MPISLEKREPEIKWTAAYRGEEPTAGSLIDAEQQPYERNHIVLHEGLVEQRVQHRGAEDVAGGEG